MEALWFTEILKDVLAHYLFPPVDSKRHSYLSAAELHQCRLVCRPWYNWIVVHKASIRTDPKRCPPDAIALQALFRRTRVVEAPLDRAGSRSTLIDDVVRALCDPNCLVRKFKQRVGFSSVGSAQYFLDLLAGNISVTQISIALTPLPSVYEALGTRTSLTRLEWTRIGATSNFGDLLASLSALPRLAVLSLEYGSSLNIGRASQLAQYIGTSSCLRRLRLDGTVPPCSSFCDAFRSNSALTSLELIGTTSTPSFTASIVEALRSHQALTSLNLRCSLEDLGGIAISKTLKLNRVLRKLTIAVTGLHQAAMAPLAESLIGNDSLQKLDISMNTLVGDEGIGLLGKALAQNSGLRKLDISHVIASSAHLEDFSSGLKMNTTLKVLRSQGNHFTAEGVSHLALALAKNNSLTDLCLWATNLGCEGAIVLADALKLNSSLRRLTLHSNWIGLAGTAALAEGLKENHSLRYLGLVSNHFGDDGGRRLLEALDINTSLRSLELGNNSFREIREEMFCKKLSGRF